MRRRKGGRIDRENRANIALRFKAMYRGLGLDLAGCAQLLQVSERTLHNWESSKHVIPFSAYKLLRLLNRMDLPGPTWDGWSFHNGKLWTPEGFALQGTDGAWWTLLVRRAAMFDQLYAENAQLRKQSVCAGCLGAKQGHSTAICEEKQCLAPAQAPTGAQLDRELKSNFLTGCVTSHEVPPMVITGITLRYWGLNGVKLGP